MKSTVCIEMGNYIRLAVLYANINKYKNTKLTLQQRQALHNSQQIYGTVSEKCIIHGENVKIHRKYVCVKVSLGEFRWKMLF